MTIDEFFEEYPESRPVFGAIRALAEQIGPVRFQVSKSQIALRRGKAFAWVWIPGRYLRRKAAPLILSLSFHYRQPSPRWKEVVEPYPGRFMHHLELYSADEVDEEVLDWLREAWLAAE